MFLFRCDSLSSTASPTLSTPHNITAGDPRTLNDQCVIHHEHNIGNNSTLNEETVVYGNISHCNKWQYSKEIYTSTIVTEVSAECVLKFILQPNIVKQTVQIFSLYFLYKTTHGPFPLAINLLTCAFKDFSRYNTSLI